MLILFFFFSFGCHDHFLRFSHKKSNPILVAILSYVGDLCLRSTSSGSFASSTIAKSSMKPIIMTFSGGVVHITFHKSSRTGHWYSGNSHTLHRCIVRVSAGSFLKGIYLRVCSSIPVRQFYPVSVFNLHPPGGIKSILASISHFNLKSWRCHLR